MTDPGFPIAAPTGASVAGLPLAMATCGECGVPLAPDQRYCVGCGARCAPLPANLIAVAVAAAAGKPTPAPDVALGLTLGPESRAAEFLATLPPRAAALAVMSMLAFGVVVGSGATSLASPSQGPLILAYAPPRAAASTPASAAPATGGGGGSPGPGAGGTTTVVQQAAAAQTVTAPGAGSGGGGGGGAPAPAAPTGPALPPVKHVFVVMLSSQGFKQLYRPASAFPYLAHTLRKQGELLTNYYGVAGSPLANSVAMISGQGPTQQTMLDCPQYTAITPGTQGKGKQIQGDGCVYPAESARPTDRQRSDLEGLRGGHEDRGRPGRVGPRQHFEHDHDRRRPDHQRPGPWEYERHHAQHPGRPEHPGATECPDRPGHPHRPHHPDHPGRLRRRQDRRHRHLRHARAHRHDRDDRHHGHRRHDAGRRPVRLPAPNPWHGRR